MGEIQGYRDARDRLCESLVKAGVPYRDAYRKATESAIRTEADIHMGSMSLSDQRSFLKASFIRAGYSGREAEEKATIIVTERSKRSSKRE